MIDDEDDMEKVTAEWAEKLKDLHHTFDDGDSIEVVQVRRRDTGPWVTFNVRQGPGIPRKLVMSIDEFLGTYGHLFENS
jgi:hypothetical protein